MGPGGQCSQAVKGSSGVGRTGLGDTGKVGASRLVGLRVLGVWLVGPQAGAQEFLGADRLLWARATGCQGTHMSSSTCEQKKGSESTSLSSKIIGLRLRGTVEVGL